MTPFHNIASLIKRLGGPLERAEPSSDDFVRLVVGLRKADIWRADSVAAGLLALERLYMRVDPQKQRFNLSRSTIERFVRVLAGCIENLPENVHQKSALRDTVLFYTKNLDLQLRRVQFLNQGIWIPRASVERKLDAVCHDIHNALLLHDYLADKTQSIVVLYRLFLAPNMRRSMTVCRRAYLIGGAALKEYTELCYMPYLRVG
ncbi:hypothetical protein PENSPDRAFT_685788 [Peniophora sp. CONT]|nr:hypothetical protein PENSPDRAFT_685788 [Peniophora sp. CONT]